MFSSTRQVSLNIDPGFKYFSAGPLISAFDSTIYATQLLTYSIYKMLVGKYKIVQKISHQQHSMKCKLMWADVSILDTRMFQRLLTAHILFSIASPESTFQTKKCSIITSN